MPYVHLQHSFAARSAVVISTTGVGQWIATDDTRIEEWAPLRVFVRAIQQGRMSVLAGDGQQRGVMVVGRGLRFGATVVAIALVLGATGATGRGTLTGAAHTGRPQERTAILPNPSYFPGYDAGYDTTQDSQPVPIVRIPF